MENNVYFLDHSLLSAQAAMNLRWREEVQKLSQDLRYSGHRHQLSPGQRSSESSDISI